MWIVSSGHGWDLGAADAVIAGDVQSDLGCGSKLVATYEYNRK
jgi:hypothetical protein